MCVCVCVCVCVCLSTCSPPGSPIYGIFQARILEKVAISSSRGSPDPEVKPASLVSGVSFFGEWIPYHSVTWDDTYMYTCIYIIPLDKVRELKRRVYDQNKIQYLEGGMNQDSFIESGS